MLESQDEQDECPWLTRARGMDDTRGGGIPSIPSIPQCPLEYPRIHQNPSYGQIWDTVIPWRQQTVATHTAFHK